MSQEKEQTFILSLDILEFYKEAFQRLSPHHATRDTLIGLAKAHSLICLGSSIEAAARTLAEAMETAGELTEETEEELDV